MNATQNLFSLKGKIALITGSARGLGEEIALAYAEMGADIVLVDRDEEGIKRVAAEVEKMGVKALTVKADLSIVKETANMTKKVKKEFGRIDILVNNAADFRSVPTLEISEEEWYRTLNDNLTSAFFCCQNVGRIMIEQNHGVIINLSSIASKIVVRPQIQPHYHIAKSGIDSMTRTLAVEWAKYNVRVNSLVPAYMQTPPVKEMMKKYGKEYLYLIPQGRIPEPREIRGPAVFLASEASSYMTGVMLMVDGGYTVY
jgi:NAD(P)-dependent dehydrogenase (short-subunit alcohol dehydrogenase family)